jgi:GTPase SAR1 family protein
MSSDMEFISYKKLVIFGAKGSGKTTFIKSMQEMKFEEDSISEDGKYIIFNHYLN